MPMPWTYRHAEKEWRTILDDLKEHMGLESDNMAYTALDGVLQVFRRRLTAQQGLDFASVLPCVVRAVFVAGWQVEETPPPFGPRAGLVREAQAVRRHHNLTPGNAIEAVARAIRPHVNPADFARVLQRLPEGAAAFWEVPGVPEADLRPRIY